MRVRVGAIGAAAGPGMTAAVDEPMLHHHSSGLVSGDRAGMGSARGRSGLRGLSSILACASTMFAAFDGWTM